MADGITIPGAPPGHNCQLSASKFGSRTARVLTTTLGYDVIAAEDESANTRAFYPMARTASDVTVAFIFASPAERDAFGDWLKSYGAWLVSSPSSLMHVSIPVRRYAIYGVPTTGVDYNQQIGNVAEQMAVVFTSVIDAHDSQGGLSGAGGVVKMPTSQSRVGSYFYPSGTQLAGNQGIDQSLYDAQMDAHDALQGVDIAAAAAVVLGIDTTPDLSAGAVRTGTGAGGQG